MPLQDVYEQLISQRGEPPVKRQKRADDATESSRKDSVPLASQPAVCSTSYLNVHADVAGGTNSATANAPSSDADQDLVRVDRELDAAVENSHERVDGDLTNPSTKPNISPQQQSSSASQAATTKIIGTEPHQNDHVHSIKTFENKDNAIAPGESMTETKTKNNRDSENKTNEPRSDFRFFLRHPHTRGRNRVLVPLSPTDCLANALRGQIILEFPTVQVFHTSCAAQLTDNVKHASIISGENDEAGRHVDGTGMSRPEVGQGDGEEGFNGKMGGGGLLEGDSTRIDSSQGLYSTTEEDYVTWGLPEGYVVMSRT